MKESYTSIQVSKSTLEWIHKLRDYQAEPNEGVIRRALALLEKEIK
jgi:hypothetical protein